MNEDIKTYLIDVLGYSEEDLEDKNKYELYALVTDLKEMNQYLGKE